MRHASAISVALLLAGTAVAASAQQHAMMFDDFIRLKAVGDPQGSPDGNWVAYTVATPSLQENRNVSHIWLADLASGTNREVTHGPGSDFAPRFSSSGRTLAFISTREGGPQLWLLPLGGGEARKVTSLSDGVGEFYWLPGDSGFVVVSDVKWPEEQEIDRRNGDYPTQARIWTGLLWRHWVEWRAGRRQHLFRVELATGKATDLTPVDADVPTIATPGDGDVAISPDGKTIAVAMHADSIVAGNTNVDVFLLPVAGGAMRNVTAASRGADNTPRFSPDGKWLSYLSMARPGFEADRKRLMLVSLAGDSVTGQPQEATTEWTLSVDSYAWCPSSRCVYATVEERGNVNVYRIDLPGHQRTAVLAGKATNTDVRIGPDGKVLVYLRQSAAQPPEVWTPARALSHQNDSVLGQLQLNPLEPYGFRGALGDSVFGWILKPPGFDATKRYPLIYLVHGGPQGAWDDNWSTRWSYQMFAARGYVVAAVNFHGSTGYGQAFTDAISQHWGDYPLDDLLKGLDVVARLPYVDSTRMAAAGASYGGYMIYWLAGHTDRFKVLVDHDGVFNPVSMYGTTEELWFPQWEFAGTPYDNRALYEKWSPLDFVQHWKTPMLIVHSQLDYRVDLSEGYQAFTALRKMGVPAKFLYFPDEGHWVLKPRNRRVWWSTVRDWIDQYLK